MSKVQTHKHTRPRKRTHVRRHARVRDHGRAKARDGGAGLCECQVRSTRTNVSTMCARLYHATESRGKARRAAPTESAVRVWEWELQRGPSNCTERSTALSNYVHADARRECAKAHCSMGACGTLGWMLSVACCDSGCRSRRDVIRLGGEREPLDTRHRPAAGGQISHALRLWVLACHNDSDTATPDGLN
jgi:hypothetical protein